MRKGAESGDRGHDGGYAGNAAEFSIRYNREFMPMIAGKRPGEPP